MLQVVHGGATARPFRTHMNAFDLDLYLRIAPELFLKRCIVGGLDRVFEINRNFRNEGADSSHSPEFAMLEFYEAHADYQDMARTTRELVQESCAALFGDHVARHHDGTEVDLSGEWPQVSLYEVTSQALGEEITPATTVEALRAHAERVDLGVDPPGATASWSRSSSRPCAALAAGPDVRRRLPDRHLPAHPGAPQRRGRGREVGPLHRRHRARHRLLRAGDPTVQRERFTAQALLAAAGDPEAMVLDEDFLEALEYGMPPTGGVGMGMDRLMMTLTGLGIRETILFPLVRPITS